MLLTKLLDMDPKELTDYCLNHPKVLSTLIFNQNIETVQNLIQKIEPDRFFDLIHQEPTILSNIIHNAGHNTNYKYCGIGTRDEITYEVAILNDQKLSRCETKESKEERCKELSMALESLDAFQKLALDCLRSMTPEQRTELRQRETGSFLTLEDNILYSRIPPLIKVAFNNDLSHLKPSFRHEIEDALKPPIWMLKKEDRKDKPRDHKIKKLRDLRD